MTNSIDNENVLLELRELTKKKENWETKIDDVAVKLNENYSDAVKAKMLWILGEMGLKYPIKIETYLEDIFSYLESDNPKLRERSTNALGRIGRADKNLVIPYLNKLMEMKEDESDNVRLAFVWACENIATNAPELFCEKLELFYEMISDSNEKVRMEAPEMFRVIGKRKPKYVEPYLKKLQWVAETNNHRVVRIHSAGAIRITKKALKKK
ncbi:HEAT repeat-containing protein [Methanobrevibacter gottschalkii]|uniref:HEAT repeat-containing protein n=1 Tax=Methanobrevibacter gottschalkii TaxID=190974 RepID=A0A1H7HFY7_9EURY|nr:sister chromatid cohesion protein PDS5 [Methanobrevibacter gottschalkii]MCQ2971186.1 HEAT repeat domain-containing protein [archaeon]SEK49219.1 HEAT repeat-containing protein [Methanobrevibacter gottschalkii]